MNHQKQDVLPKAAAIWPDILVNLAGIDASIFDHRKEHPCVLCGGKTRFRYRAKPAGLDRPFYCNHCGSKNGIEFFIAYTGMDYGTAINSIGDYIGNIPQEKIEVKQREFEIQSQFPSWYKFNSELYDTIKKAATVDLSAWQWVNGLNMLDILKHGDDALVPLLDKNGNPVDFVMIDVEGNYQTTAGNKIIPDGFYSTFGETKGKYIYLAVSPLVAAHASVFMQRQVVCVWELENIWEVGKDISRKKLDKKHSISDMNSVVNALNFDNEWQPPVVIVSNIAETQEADSVKFSQLVFNSKNNTVNRRLYQPGEIMKERGNKNE